MDKSTTTVIEVDKGLHPPPPLPLPPAATAASIVRSFEQPPQPPSTFKLHLALVIAQAGFAGYEVLLRRTMRKGTSILVLSFYRNCVGFLVLRLFASLFEKKNKPVLNFGALFATLLLGVFGYLLSFPGCLTCHSIFRMEKVDLERIHGIAKLAGSILLICGWMLLLVYKGQRLLRSRIPFLPHALGPIVNETHHPIKLGGIHLQLNNQQYGTVFLLMSCLSTSIFLILQAFIMEKYAAPVSFASFACFFGIIQAGIAAAIHAHHSSAWSTLSIGEGVSIAYAGLIGSGLVFGIQSWGVKQGGPMLVAAYQPLETVITIVLAFFLLRESLHLGSIIGGGMILVGLYLIVWSKEREQRFDALCVVQDFQGMSSTNTDRPSDVSYGENGVASSATRSCFEPTSMEQNMDNVSIQQKTIATVPWYCTPARGSKKDQQRNASWVFTQPLFAEDEQNNDTKVQPDASGIDQAILARQNHDLLLSKPFSRQHSLNAPVSMEHDAPWLVNGTASLDQKLAWSKTASQDEESSSSSTEMASTRSNFSRWNSGRTATSRANSVRSVPSRLSSASAAPGPSRANSIRSVGSKLTSARSIASDSSSSESDQVNSSRTSTSSE